MVRVRYNSNARTVIDLRDPEPRNVFIQNNSKSISLIWQIRLLERKAPFSIWVPMSDFAPLVLVPTNQRTEFHLFEANPNLIPLLKQSIELHPSGAFTSITAVSATRTEKKFQLATNQSGQSHVSRFRAKVEIPNLVLDDYCDQHQIDCAILPRLILKDTSCRLCKAGRKIFQITA